MTERQQIIDNIKSIIAENAKQGKDTPVKYHPTTEWNRELIECFLNDNTYGTKPVFVEHKDTTKEFQEIVNDAVSQLKKEFPELNAVTRRIEHHFYYSGFNGVFHENAIVKIAVKEQPKKTGIVKENYDLLSGTKKVIEILDKYPDYELYLRQGYGFRGAQEQESDRNAIIKSVERYCTFSAKIVDNEIHINTFDMD